MKEKFKEVPDDDDISPPSVVRKPEGVELALQQQAGVRLGVTLQLGEELGHGGMGTVHAARDTWLGRQVAVKLLSDSVDKSDAADRRFILEAQLAAQLEHPNIVPFYELLVAKDGAPALVMRLVRGRTMAAYLADCASSKEISEAPPSDLPSRLERFLKVCDAVSYAHARSVIHRDLKPENVMLGAHHEVYVMDWGVARVIADEKELGFDNVHLADVGGTRNDEIVGTPGYMAPEQAAAEPATFAVDQYALGMMLTEIVTLNVARPGSELEQLSSAMLASEVRIEPRFGEEVPRPLDAIIRKSTARRPEHRYPNVDAFAADLRRFLRDEAISILRDSPSVRAWRWAKRRPVWVLGAFTALVSAVAVLTVFVLVQRIEAVGRAERRSERLSEITAAIGRRARNVDTQFQRLALLIEGLAGAGSQTLLGAPEPEARAYAPADLASFDTTLLVGRYGQRVSFVHAAAVASQDANPEKLTFLHRRAGEWQRLLEDTAARASGRDAVLSWSSEERQRVARSDSPLLWTDIAFDDGLLFVYPGNTFFPVDYDVRQRPWFVDAKRQSQLRWGSPYPDATSGRLLLPCSRAFFDRAGQFRGVAAGHLALDGVLDTLEFHDVAGFRSAALVDDRGDVVLSTLARGVDLGKGTHDNRALVREPFPVPAVRDAIASKRPDGRVFDLRGLYVFQRLDGNGWWLVATLDRTVVD